MVSQERIIRTAIPGPRSLELQARKVTAVSAGIGTVLPIYVKQASGGIVLDVDGNHLIDFGSGIAVTIGRQRRPPSGRRPCRSRSRTSPTPASW